MNPFVQFVAVVWVCAAIGAIFTKSAEPFVPAAAVTILAGIGYFILQLK